MDVDEAIGSSKLSPERRQK